jgi:hypothetical protein
MKLFSFFWLTVFSTSALLIFSNLFSNYGWAADSDQTHALMTTEEQEIHERAKKRIYPGGRDEEPLKVQAQLQLANRKMGPATEAPPEDTAADAATD